MAETFPSQKRIRRSTWSWCVRWKWRERLQNRSSPSWQDFTISFPSGWFQSLTSKSWSYWFLDYRTSTWMTWKPTRNTINTQRTHYRYLLSFLLLSVDRTIPLITLSRKATVLESIIVARILSVPALSRPIRARKKSPPRKLNFLTTCACIFELWGRFRLLSSIARLCFL